MKIIVTAGAKGADIDVLACAIAYSELLELEGHKSIPVIPGTFTSSITPSILKWGANYESYYHPNGSEKFVLVDISDPAHFPEFVTHDHIIEVYDHRHGHIDLWQKKLNDSSHIEMVGSCATLIWEQFKQRAKEKEISTVSAKLLLASIVSNNLAFRSPLTTDRDRSAYADLSALTGLNETWIQSYFKEQEEILLSDFVAYVEADTKVFKIEGKNFAIGQIEMWDASNLLETKQAQLDSIMSKYTDIPWIVNILNISKGYNLIYSTSYQAKKLFEKHFDFTFKNNIARTHELLMRKHLMHVLKKNEKASHS